MTRFLRRRAVLALAAAAACTGALAQSPEWAPSRPVRIIVPIVGSTNDVLARLIAPKLQEAIGQPVVVENKPGAGGNIGADLVAKAQPDGHTLLVGYNGPLAINVTLFDKMPYDPLKDLQPLTLAVKAPQYLVVNPASGITSVQDLLARAKEQPGKLSYASIAVGSASHLTMEMLKSAAGVHITHIPYRGAGPAVTDLLGNQVQVGFFVPGNVQQFAREGKLKLIASSGAKRFPSTPDVPTLAESGFKDFEATSWIGFLTTANTPRPIVERYHRELVKIIRSPEITQRLHEMEFEVVASTPEQFGSWIRSEIPRWGKVIKETGAKAE
ncbi:MULTISPECIES: Bug family tripartite tricarboxylate transporter substrate binding protein [Ramlibacter]|uniref:Tripartite tricarboxylate transporter substrate binding protein n=1 Tax=Ramlibacter pinisoli TaxID=2682844 RepID=A0A6N8IVU6_9BURK|nr:MULTISPECIES: tripartite tricarboxylate transporter substrate binding protein [Ramlibacter]MBA2965118.1 tripartite tricarboxylate transporter substrate binding protein [Ramlibacter sp. CGMCC 1.13660]MVQ30083.1 tripartite tricarboxylate transporter substrate binding protein [Ramlibacter pinisoli]